MASFYRNTVKEFLQQTEAQIRDRLQMGYAKHGYVTQFTDQTLTWEQDIRSLRRSLVACIDTRKAAESWEILLEFSIPRKEKRIDVVILVGDVIVIVESKRRVAGSEAKRQIEEYALLLHYFHKASTERRVIPVLISPDATSTDVNSLQQGEFFPQLATYWIRPVAHRSWSTLPQLLEEVARDANTQIHADTWNDSPYFPVPTIIDAATALRSGLSIREIAHSEASEHQIADVRETIQGVVDHARKQQHHAICFLTGVPGSGKTLVGLSLAHSAENKADAIHFMSGNGPLVKVLQHLFTQEGRREGASAPQARVQAKTLIENVHVFASYYTDTNPGAPSNHAIIFDEAQRAWNRKQNLRKFKRDYSEPEMLLSIMERHMDWAVVVALVGGGQEINDGEAGLEEWGRALLGAKKEWFIHASPEVLNGGASTAGHRLFAEGTDVRDVVANSSLHLRTSNRSLRAENLATWVNCLLDGDHAGAAALKIYGKFPIFLSRELNATRSKLGEQGIGTNRCGLVGSSGAARLRADGLEPDSSFHSEYPWEHWYLAEAGDIRSSYRCEVFATEFEIQGLELDWIGLCWGGDFIWSDAGWRLRAFRHGRQSKWSDILSKDKRTYRRNAYRVLLTRARKGMVIYVPRGSADDSTCSPAEFDATAEYLLKCGVTAL